MENEDIIKIYQNYKIQCSRLLDSASLFYMYDQKYITDSHEEIRKELVKEFKNVDFREFTKDSLIKDFNFGSWDGDLILCPLWTLGLIKDGTELCTISDETIIVGKDKLDNDARFGFFAYGFKIDQLRDYRLKNIIE